MDSNVVLQVAKDYGPAILGVAGALLSFALTFIGFALRYIWKTETSKISKLAKALGTLSQAVDSLSSKATSDHAKVWEQVQTLRSELTLHIRLSENSTKAITMLEGSVKQQQDTIYHQMGIISKISAQLEALFKFIDAPRRATDSK